MPLQYTDPTSGKGGGADGADDASALAALRIAAARCARALATTAAPPAAPDADTLRGALLRQAGAVFPCLGVGDAMMTAGQPV